MRPGREKAKTKKIHKSSSEGSELNRELSQTVLENAGQNGAVLGKISNIPMRVFMRTYLMSRATSVSGCLSLQSLKQNLFVLKLSVR